MPMFEGPGWHEGWRDPENSEGCMTSCIVGLLGSVGIAWAGTRVAIAHHWPTRNITIDQEVMILVATTGLEFIFIKALWRLLSVPKLWMGRFEAMTLNAFIWVGSRLLSGLEYINQNTCFSTQTLQTGLNHFVQKAQQGTVQVFRFGYQRDENALSSQNLVGATLTNVGVGPVSQSVAQDAVDLVEQGQFGGGAQPGAICPGAI